jgi:20S proteasome subunit alpha 6
MSIGARSQSARTYLEKHLNEFPTCNLDELIKHALRALRDTLPNEIELSTKVNFIVFLLKIVLVFILF